MVPDSGRQVEADERLPTLEEVRRLADSEQRIERSIIEIEETRTAKRLKLVHRWRDRARVPDVREVDG